MDKQIYERLKCISGEISESLSQLREELIQVIQEYDKEIKEAQIALQRAYEMGDLRENAEFDAALQRCSTLGYSRGLAEQKLRSINGVGEDEKNYEPIGMVVMYSTVLLTNDRDTGVEFVFKLYPADVSDLGRRILSVDSPIGKLLYLRNVGDVFNTEHRVTGVKRRWKVEAVY